MTALHPHTQYRSALTHNDAELIEHRTIHDKDGVIFKECQIEHSRHEGGAPIKRETLIMEYPNSVAVIAYDPVNDCLALVEQFRSGAFLSPLHEPDASPWLAEVVAGSAPETVPLIDTARQEVQEELGCEVKDIFEVFRYFTNPALLTTQTTLFCAQVERLCNTDVRGDDAYGENLKPIWLPLDAAQSWIEGGMIRDAMTLVSVQWLILNINDVRNRWRA